MRPGAQRLDPERPPRRPICRHRREDGFEKRPHLGQLLDPDDDVPCALELFSTPHCRRSVQPVLDRLVRRRRLKDGAPAVERFIGPVIPPLQFFR